MSENLSELEALREENERLKAKNEKLYKDCVTFAKKIKAHEEIDNKLASLEKENADLKAEVSKLNETASDKATTHIVKVKAKAVETPIEDEILEPLPIVDEPQEPKTIEEIEKVDEPLEEVAAQETIEPEEVVEVEQNADAQTYESFMASDEEVIDFPSFVPERTEEVEENVQFEEEEIIIEPEVVVIPKNHNAYKKSPWRTFFRVIISIILTFSLIIGIASSVTYLFCTAYADYGIANYRFACVRNSALSPSFTTDDVVLIKYSNFSGMELGSPVVTTKDGRSIGLIKSVDVKDGEYVATIEDKTETYEVYENQFYGKVVFKVPYLGKVVTYACDNPYNYLAIVVSANLICIALLLIIPSNKSKKPKFGKDYGVEDFTI